MGTDSNDLKNRLAVKTIVDNCAHEVTGDEARRLLSTDRFTEPKVRELAGTSPEHQRHVIGRALAGDPNPNKKIAANLLVYETVGFYEVTSRLNRALGYLRIEAQFLKQAAQCKRPPSRLRLDDRLLTLDLIAKHAQHLLKLLLNTPTNSEAGTPANREAEESEMGCVPEKLYAATTLGLVAKNLRDVAVLQREHRPTHEEKKLALYLTRATLKLARTARDATRGKFGPADNSFRIGPKTPARRVITHAAVDGDAIVSAWLAERFLFAGESIEVLFLPLGRVLGAYRRGDCLVAVGNTLDAENLFFDCKPPAFVNKFDSCAARLIWDHLIALGFPVKHLRTLVDAVFAESLEKAADSLPAKARFAVEYMNSKRHGFHKALADAKRKHSTDAKVYRFMRRWLDNHDKKTTANQKG